MRNLLILLLICGGAMASEPADGVITAQMRVYFSPDGGAEQAIVDAIGQARTEIRMQAYSFTAVPIAKALSDAKARGVDVRVIVDKTQTSELYTVADFVAGKGVEVVVDARPRIMHSKVIIIDNRIVVTGSYNFTKSASRDNVENLLVIDSVQLAARYHANWDERRAQCIPYVRKSDRAAKP